MRRLLPAAAVGALLLIAAPAQAATFQVNTAADDTTCNTITCSVRGALTAAQANGAAADDVINVPAGTFPVATELSVTGTRITVVGAGANSTVIHASGTNRVLNVTSNAGLAITGVTVRGGRPTTGTGGNIAVGSTASLTLTGVRVTDGRAAGGGGGLSAAGSTAITISRSLLDGNVATGTGEGGAIWMPGQTSPTQLTITDSTITGNNAANGGAIATTFNAPVPPENRHTALRGVTVAFNTARDGGQGGIGGIQTDSSAVRFQGSVITGNTSTLNVGAGTIQAPANCAIGGTVTDEGGNVEDQNQCGLTAASAVNTNAQLATTLDASAQPPALALPAGSPAVDFADCGGRTFDQRGVPRPQGVRCDAGAYEYNPPPTTVVAGAAPPFTFSSNEAGTTFECSLDGAPFVPCVSPYDPGAAPGAHTLVVRAVDAQGVPDPNPQTVAFTVQPPPPQPTPTATPVPTPTPIVNRTVVVAEVKGTVKIKRKGSRRYVDLGAAESIPVGSSVDTRKGTVELTSIPKAGAPPEKARFYDGLFTIGQARGVTTLKLTERLAACPKKKSAGAAAKKAKKRKLWGDGKGAFRTQGKYSAATVRGTKWLVEDSCAGTLTRVTQGSVTVTHGKKRVIVRAGKRYLAKPR